MLAVVELVQTDHEFLLYGLWVAAITSLAGALLFAGLSALFAVINTATTPIGTVTGVPGLYLWNSLASECKQCNFTYASNSWITFILLLR
jgi:hypothetical protein